MGRKTTRIRIAILAAAAATFLGGFVLTSGLAALSAIIHPAIFPSSSGVLSEADKALLTEALHLRRSLGEAIWPGFAGADIPVLVYDEEYVYLLEYTTPPDGWTAMTGGTLPGPWQTTPADTFRGGAYYRLRLSVARESLAAPAAMVGARWAAMVPARTPNPHGTASGLSGRLPPLLDAMVSSASNPDLALGATDAAISRAIRQAFYAFQAQAGGSRLSAATQLAQDKQATVAYAAPNVRDGRRAELSILAEAVRVPSDAVAELRACRFVEERRRRRTATGDAMAAYEREREWAEGLARYAQLMAWQKAAASPSYLPVAALSSDATFKRYTAADAVWQRELEQMPRAADDPAAYYAVSGMGQALVLDRIYPGWKNLALTTPAGLDQLLASRCP